SGPGLQPVVADPLTLLGEGRARGLEDLDHLAEHARGDVAAGRLATSVVVAAGPSDADRHDDDDRGEHAERDDELLPRRHGPTALRPSAAARAALAPSRRPRGR